MSGHKSHRLAADVLHQEALEDELLPGARQGHAALHDDGRHSACDGLAKRSVVGSDLAPVCQALQASAASRGVGTGSASS